jgi:hypothetical protein
MGMRVIDARQWIELDHFAPADLQLKERLLQQARPLVFAADRSAADAALELLGLLVDHLCRWFPAHYQATADHVDCLLTGQRFHRPPAPADAPVPADAAIAAAVHPLEIVARLVQDDFCLMEPVDGQAILAAGCVCFPSRWNIREKLGQSTAAIHGPVPSYDAHIGPQTDQFMTKLTPDRIVARENWSLHDSPTQFRPDAPPMWPDGLAVADVPEKVWLRVERQTLRRLPRSGFIAFGIRTYIRPLSDLLGRPEVRTSLAHAVDSWPAEVIAYKGCTASIAAIRDWLRQA